MRAAAARLGHALPLALCAAGVLRLAHAPDCAGVECGGGFALKAEPASLAWNSTGIEGAENATSQVVPAARAACCDRQFCSADLCVAPRVPVRSADELPEAG